MILENMVGERVVVVSTEKHPQYSWINHHYIGQLRTYKENQVVLSDWNDHIGQCMGEEGLFLETRPTTRSKEVVIPHEKVKHLYRPKEESFKKRSDEAVLLPIHPLDKYNGVEYLSTHSFVR